METLKTVVQYEIWFLLGSLGAVVGFQIITGKISTKGLLSDKADNGVGSFSPARLQLLLFSFGVAFYILGKVFGSIAAGGDPLFPDIDPNVLVVLGASHALYLGAKALPSSGSQPNNSNK